MREVVVVHGGAGSVTRERVEPHVEARMREGLRAALLAGQRALADGGSAVDAVEQAVRELEDCEVFNAGHGAVLTSAGTAQMDASIMRGSDRAAGAVAGVQRVANPVAAARVVLERGRHVLMIGREAELLAEEAGLPLAEPESFITDHRREQLRRAARPQLDHDGATEAGEAGTVGAVALDAHGGLAAATSTGGMTGQAPGRVGDSPIVGAGTWAEDGVCAISATGPGELILRSCFAHEASGWIVHRSVSLGDACGAALARVGDLGGQAGCIAIDARGDVATPFTTGGMPRGVVRGDGAPEVAIFRDE